MKQRTIAIMDATLQGSKASYSLVFQPKRKRKVGKLVITNQLQLSRLANSFKCDA